MYLFKFADIGEGIHEGTILKWNVKEGDTVKEGETLVVVETDKVNAELPSPVSGVVKKLNFKEGDDIHVGDVIIEIDDGTGSKVEEPVKEIQEQKEPKKDAPKEKGAGVVGEIDVSDEIIASTHEEVVTVSSNKVLASPVARKLASDLNVDLAFVSGSGPQGRVLKADVEGFKKPVFAQQPIEETETIKVSRHRRAISSAMSQSKRIVPHTVLFDEVNVDKLVEVRKEAKEYAAKQGVKLTYIPFISKAVLIALKEFPKFNASFDDEKGELYLKKHINLGIAVDTESGLIVPNVKQAQSHSLLSLANEINTLAAKASDKTLTLEEQQKGTFTITNFGSVGVPYGTPIINYPEVAILGIGKIDKKAIVVEDSIKIGYMLPLSLAVDHRIIDGADAGRFINRIKELLSNPTLLLLS